MDYSYLDRNVGKIKGQITAAAERAGRDPRDIMLVAAVKYADADEINYLCHKAGIKDIGENRVQQMLEHLEKIDADGVRIHFIGSLQTNKVKYIIDKVHMIHSLDSERLAAEIDKQAGKRGICARVLVEINSGNEESKGGVLPDMAEELCLSLSKYKNIELCGFMTMAPRCERKEDYYRYFGDTVTLCEKIWHDSLGREDKMVLSMGMSESFEIAIECGSSAVRVGRSLFYKD